jgi:glycerophosphoryl diester phosphodiesterase
MSLSRRLLAGGLAVVAAGTAFAGFASAGGATPAHAQAHRRLPIVIAHRGASAYRPEESVHAYQLAIEMGADYIEPDLCFTKDGKLVARHEPDIGGTTDVADHPEFASRRRTVKIDNTTFTNTWFTFDFTLAELKTLRAKERLPDVRPANTAHNGLYEVPTFQEVIDLAKQHGVGIYPETKHPTFFETQIGYRFDGPLLGTLSANGLNHRGAKVFIQSFEVGNLQRLNTKTRLPLVQLIDATGGPADMPGQTYDQMVTPAGLAAIARYADGIGPDKSRIVKGNTAGSKLGAPTTLIRDAHRVGLVLHPFTFRPENNFLAADFRQGNPASPEFLRSRGDQPAELKLYYELGVDGLFADNADTAVAVREKTFNRARA